MSNVAYIKQKAIEIANNSSHEIIIGVMNQKDVEADCSAVSHNIDELYARRQVSARRQVRDELREQRKSERMERRSAIKAEILARRTPPRII